MVKKISAAQCRAARALLGLTQPQLARAANLGLSTVVDFEKGRRVVSDDVTNALKNALEKLDIEFIEENGGGVGVRLRKPSRGKHRG